MKWRSFWAWREVEEEVVATVNGIGGDSRGGGKSPGKVRGVRGVRGVAGGVQGNEGQPGRVEVARARRAHALLPSKRRLKMVAAALGQLQCWARWIYRR